MSTWRPVGGQIRPGAPLRPAGRAPAGARRSGKAPKGTSGGWRGPFGWSLWQTALAVVATGIALFILLVIVVAAQLPDPSNVQVHAGEVKILDRTGTKLIADETGGANRVQVPLNHILVKLQHATVAAEDPHFYEYPLIV